MKRTFLFSILIALWGLSSAWAEEAESGRQINVTTTATEQNGKMYFTSANLQFTPPCNKLRFTLTESGAFYSNGKKRMSFDSFELLKADGSKVDLDAAWFTGNYSKTYANMLDGVNGTFCCGAWGAADEGDDYFEISLPEEIDLGGAFSFSFVTENTTMNAKAFTIDVISVVVNKYTLRITGVPTGKEVTVLYDGTEYAAGAQITEGFDTELFSATDLSGYTWKVVVDEVGKTISIVYTAAPVQNNPEAVVALANRIGGAGTADKFLFVLDPSLNSKQEVFVLGAEGGKVLVKGTTTSAITAGLGWYLNNIAGINIAWNSLNEKGEDEAYVSLTNLPLPSTEERHTCAAKYRYYLNYCTFGYSMTSWTWKRWQQEIDWMALHGINMPLQIVGLEEVWRMFLTLETEGVRKYKYTDAEAKAFVAGPAFTAWWGMNNLEGWGGTASDGWGGVQDDAWYARQKALASKILSRQRELGIDPVLPGFSGMVPSNFTSKTGVATDNNGGSWCGFTRPYIIDPTAERFAEIAADYYACLKEVMGESQYYSMDPFHEGGSISSGKYAEAYTAVYDAMESAKSGAQWVIQQWQWSANQRLSLNAVPAGKLIVLDLFSDGSPAFDGYNGYAPQDAVFCAIPNFGGRSGLMGRLNNLTDNYFLYREKFSTVKGIGAAPEAIEQTPVTYDLLFQLPWMESKPNVAEWVSRYASVRYGADNEVVKVAWDLLRQSALGYGADGIQGPVEDVWAARPNLNAYPASTWGVTINSAGGTYTKARRQMVADATFKLLGAYSQLGIKPGSVYESNYFYDLVEFGGAVMADYAYDLLLGIKAAKEAAGSDFASNATYRARRDAFLALIADMDTFRGTNLNFRLGKWTEEARDAAAEVEGAVYATADWYEFNNARTLITTWGDQTQNGGLKDYSYRSWQGLLKDYYLPRWKYFFDHNCEGTNYFFFEWNWAHGMVHEVGQTSKSTTRLTPGQAGYSYSRTPEGNTVQVANEMLSKYILPITTAEGTYYAYRYLDNDLSSTITIVAKGGDVLDLTAYFPALEDATLTGDFIEGSASDLSRILVKGDAADGTHTATLSLSDGTTLSFSVVLNPAYYGTYFLNLKDGSTDAPVFVAYNEDEDNGRNKGYKMIATGTYSTKALGDKIFTVAPLGTGFSFSAQGKVLKAPYLSGWQHVMFSDNSADAGSYLIEETSTEGVFKIRSTGSGNNYVNKYAKGVLGNDASNKPNLSTFSLVPVTQYPLSIDESGVATVCLPFHVALPEGVEAYDCAASNVVQDADGSTCTMERIVSAGEILCKGTPALLKATTGRYDLEIKMEAPAAKKGLGGSLLKGTLTAQTLAPGTGKYLFSAQNGGTVLSQITATQQMPANTCWLESSVSSESIKVIFSKGTGVGDVIETVASPARMRSIYNVAGQRLSRPQKGLIIVDGKKVVVTE